MTRRTIAAIVACGALVAPPAAAQQATTSTPAPTTLAPSPSASGPAPGATTTAPARSAPAPAQRAAEDRDTAATVLLLVVGGLVLATLLLLGLAHWQAWEPPWLVRWRHATGEAGWRAGSAWAEFTDWLRLGR